VRPAGLQTRCLSDPRKGLQRSKTPLGAQTGKSVFPWTAATGLTLGELEAFARPRLTGFLAFFHARIAPQQAIGL
jgi:hypothetical protein